MKRSGCFFCLTLLILLSACTGPVIRDEYPEPEPGYASEPAQDGPFADLERKFEKTHGIEKSGFLLLENNLEALEWRLAMIDEARYSLDVQYYLWYGDDSGRLILKRILDAARRGVRIRLIADGILLVGKGKNLAAIETHPNIEVRIFNPFEQNRLRGKKKAYQTLERFNFRMHNKIIVADNRVTILGGRNLGNDYFGLNRTYNFLDLDIIGVGPAARLMSGIFDHFWNSNWVVPAYAYDYKVQDGLLQDLELALNRNLNQSEVLQEIPLEPQKWTDRINNLATHLHPGTCSKVYDKLEEDAISQRMATEMPEFSKDAQKEVLINNAYLIPDEDMLANASKMVQRGVKIRIITNSLASQDVPAVNSHYGPLRRPILETGIDLYELRPDATVKDQVDTPPVVSGFVGLHAKASVVDRTRVFIGSFNLDPRSRNINTEMGIVIDSPELGEELADKIEFLMEPENSWRVETDESGKLIWVSHDGTLTRQPAQNFWQRVQDVFFKIFPKEYF